MAKKSKLRAQRDVLAADLAGTEADLSVAHERIDGLLSTLCWYADPANYGADGADYDVGERARRALGRAAGPGSPGGWNSRPATWPVTRTRAGSSRPDGPGRYFGPGDMDPSTGPDREVRSLDAEGLTPSVVGGSPALERRQEVADGTPSEVPGARRRSRSSAPIAARRELSLQPTGGPLGPA